VAAGQHLRRFRAEELERLQAGLAEAREHSRRERNQLAPPSAFGLGSDGDLDYRPRLSLREELWDTFLGSDDPLGDALAAEDEIRGEIRSVEQLLTALEGAGLGRIERRGQPGGDVPPGGDDAPPAAGLTTLGGPEPTAPGEPGNRALLVELPQVTVAPIGGFLAARTEPAEPLPGLKTLLATP
jgi:hypothetical protein